MTQSWPRNNAAATICCRTCREGKAAAACHACREACKNGKTTPAYQVHFLHLLQRVFKRISILGPVATLMQNSAGLALWAAAAREREGRILTESDSHCIVISIHGRNHALEPRPRHQAPRSDRSALPQTRAYRIQTRVSPSVFAAMLSTHFNSKSASHGPQVFCRRPTFHPKASDQACTKTWANDCFARP